MATDAKALRTQAPPPVQYQRHLVDTRLGKMHVRVAGEGGNPVLLCHTQFFGGRWWDWIAPLLAVDRQVIIHDRIGFGDSDHPSEPLRIEDFAAATVDALDAIGVNQVDAVGVHTGSKEVVELASAHAARVRRAVLTTIAVYTDEEKEKTRAMFASPPPGLDDEGTHAASMWKFWRGALPEGLPLELANTWFVETMKSWPNHWWTFLSSTNYLAEERLPSLEQPLLVIVPHDDGVVATRRALESAPPQVEVIDLPHVTNVMNIFTTNADEIVGYVREFLDR